MQLADGSEHPTGYWAEEVIEPYRRFARSGVEVVVATPDGERPQPDPWGLEPYFHYPQEDEDFMLSVFRSFAPDADDIRITFQHFSELNLVAARRVFQALVDSGMAAEQARGLVESAARTAWWDRADFVEVLAAIPAIAARVPREQIEAIRDAVWDESAANAKTVAAELDSIADLNSPRRLSDLSEEEIRSLDAVFVPGGHGPMVDLVDNLDMRRILGQLHRDHKTIAALCHGPAALLSAPSEGGTWLFDGYKLTAFTDEEEDQTEAGRIGLRWYLEDALKNQGAVFDDGDSAWMSHVVVDRNLITAQNPGSSEAAADAVLKRLEV